MARRPKNRLKQVVVREISLVSKPALGLGFLLQKSVDSGDEVLTMADHKILDDIIKRYGPTRHTHEPAPDAVPQHELARIRAYMGGR